MLGGHPRDCRRHPAGHGFPIFDLDPFAIPLFGCSFVLTRKRTAVALFHDHSVIITKEIDRLIDETETFDTISGPHWTDNGKFKVWTLFAGRDVLAISTSAPLDTDDIALEVGRDAADLSRERVPELRSVAIVDAHKGRIEVKSRRGFGSVFSVTIPTIKNIENYS